MAKGQLRHIAISVADKEKKVLRGDVRVLWVDDIEGTKQEIEANGGKFTQMANSSGERRAQIP